MQIMIIFITCNKEGKWGGRKEIEKKEEEEERVVLWVLDESNNTTNDEYSRIFQYDTSKIVLVILTYSTLAKRKK